MVSEAEKRKCPSLINNFLSILKDLGSDEESGKDWSDLEREAAEEDRNNDYATDDKRNGKFESKKHSKSSKHRYADCFGYPSSQSLLILFSVMSTNTIQQESPLFSIYLITLPHHAHTQSSRA